MSEFKNTVVGIDLPVIIASKFSWADMQFSPRKQHHMIWLAVDTKSR